MKILKRKLKRGGCGWESPDLECEVLSSDLNHLWEIPEDVKTIWISLHTTKGLNRVPVVVRDGGWDQFSLRIDQHRAPGCGVFGDDALDDDLKKFAGKRLHLELEYE